MLPILTIRNAAGPRDESTVQARHAALPSGQRAEAIQKILDALGRHLSDKEVLSRDALVRLMEDLARILKFPPLPQESGRDFVKRLIGFLESMPMPERLLLERQLGGRSLAHRIAVLTAVSNRGQASASIAAGGMPSSPQPQDATAIRNLPVQTAVPPQFAAIKASASSDLVLLQSILKKTFSADEEGGPVEAMLEGAMDEMPEDAAETGASKASEQRARPPQLSAAANREATAALGGDLAQDELAAFDTALPLPQPESEGADTGGGAAETRGLAGEPVSPEPAPSDMPLAAQPDDTEQVAHNTETGLLEQGADETGYDDGLEADGTYGRPLPDTEDGRQQTQPRASRGEPGGQSARSLADAMKVIIRDGIALPEFVDEDGRPAAEPESGDTRQQPAAARSTSDPAERSRDAGIRSRNGTEAPLADHAPTDEPDKTAQRSPMQARGQNPGNDPAMQQMLSRLVETGLPREAIPFAMVPYPPAKAELDDATDTADRREQAGDGESDTGADAEDGEDDREAPAKGSPDDGNGDPGEERGAIDAYGLYRKLGDLG
ncbi:hypothetical protein QN224_00950 [Sinorhizobium sp. 8-89]|uniref:hypothetical protein n=1 Tax=Sinorhizobium sp. 7-81 TaxID=3049087 RepID=UPI0024C2ACAF|nr:hypothetical protein [Sinorhizobium sp. 7-81]MDK1383972.1 hypothetical protein [Sinorhizobium sp. 7-81]